MTTEIVTRDSKGLVDALFESIDQLNAKKIDPEHARALSHTAKAIVSIAALELEFRKFAKDNSDADQLKSLAIDATAKRLS